jgi:hypothetical protein
MPKRIQPTNLKIICLKNIASNMDKHWIRKYGTLQSIIEVNEKSQSHKIPMYFLGPFDALNDSQVEFILKELNDSKCLNKLHLYLLIHDRLRRIDLSYIRKPALVNANLCKFIGNMCRVKKFIYLFIYNEIILFNFLFHNF